MNNGMRIKNGALVDHIGEYTSAHGVIFDNIASFTALVKLDHVAEYTGSHGVVFDHLASFSASLKTDHIGEYTGSHGVVVDHLADFVGNLKTDTISEHTAAAGVTIDTLKIKDGMLTLVAVTNGSPAAGDFWYESTGSKFMIRAGASAQDSLNLSSSMRFISDQDCSGNPNYPAGHIGDLYVVSVAGLIGGASGVAVEVGDLFLCKVGNAGGTQAAVGTSWTIVQTNIPAATLASFVVGPASATDNAIARFDTTTGKLIQNSTATLGDDGTLTATTFSGSGASLTSLNGDNVSSGTIALARGGTGTSAASAIAAFNALSPMTTLGDILYGGPTPAGQGTRLAGNTVNKRYFLGQTGTGAVSAAPAWFDLIDTTTTLGTSDLVVPSQKAVKTYCDNLIGANDAMVYKGVIDCSGNPNYPAADAGWTYKVSVAGKIGGASGLAVQIGDMIICCVDGTASGDQATRGANWNIIQTNIDGAVVGPASATDNDVVLFDGTTGKLVKGGGKGDLAAGTGLSWSAATTGRLIGATSATISIASGYYLPTTTDQTNWNHNAVSLTGQTTGTVSVDTVAVASVRAVRWDYVVTSTTNTRVGSIIACNDGTSAVSYSEYSATEIGATSPIDMVVDYSSPNMRLTAVITSGTWAIKTIRSNIG